MKHKQELIALLIFFTISLAFISPIFQNHRNQALISGIPEKQEFFSVRRKTLCFPSVPEKHAFIRGKFLVSHGVKSSLLILQTFFSQSGRNLNQFISPLMGAIQLMVQSYFYGRNFHQNKPYQTHFITKYYLKIKTVKK